MGLRTSLVGASIAAALVAAPASAATRRRSAPTDARAVDLFEQSIQAYREGRFQDAVDRLLEARTYKAEPVLLYNLGRAYEALGRPGEAAAAYEKYLSEEPEAADRGAIEGRIATLRAQEAELAAARQPTPPVAGKAERPADRGTGEPLAIVPWVLVGGGALAVGGGIVLGALADSRHEEAVAEPVQRSAAEDQQAAESLATAANVTLLAGAVIAVVGLSWIGVRAVQPARTSRDFGLRVTF